MYRTDLKYRTHTAHDQHPAIPSLQTKEPAEQGGGTATDLQSRAFSACRAAEQMGDGSGKENGGGDFDTHIAAAEDSVDHLIGTPIAALLKKGVDTDGQQTTHRQQEDKPGVLTAQMCDKMQDMMEPGA